MSVQARRVSAVEQLPSAPPQISPGASALVETTFRGLTIGAKILHFPLQPWFFAGSQRGADAPCDLSFERELGALVEVGPQTMVISLPRLARARTVDSNGEVTVIGAAATDRLLRLPLTERSAARIEMGEMHYSVSYTPRPVSIGRAPWRWRTAVHGYFAGAGFLIVTVLALLFSLPRDPKTLSFDIAGKQYRTVVDLRIPPVVREVPKGNDSSARNAPPSPAARRGPPPRKAATPGPTSVAATPEATAAAVANAGILGVIGASRDPSIARIFGRDSALAMADGMDLLGGDPNVLAALGPGISGTGARDGFDDGGPRGTGTLGTIGGPGGGPTGVRYGRDVGRLGPRGKVPPPAVVPGSVTTRGGLDREVVRRIVRRHINEVRYCYEQALVKARELAGRLVIEFTVGPQGRVLASAVAEGVGNATVEACVTQAVRRWEFPAPVGGGLVIARYPFVLTAPHP